MRIMLLARKQGMTQVFNEAGERIPVTVLTVGPCTVTQVKTPEKDGYASVQIGFEEKKQERTTRALQGHAKRAKTTPKKTYREFRVKKEDLAQFQVGQTLTVDVFQPGDFVDIVGTSKGRGFQGVMKRHKMAGFRATHGTHETFRSAGSIGMRTWPAKVIKGKRMEGHMGDERVTVQNVKVLEVHPDQNAVILKGCLPGHRRALVSIGFAVKRKAPSDRLKAKATDAPAESAPETPAQ